MPRRRKGIDCPPDISVLLRDAQPTRAQIAGEPDARKRHENERARDLAAGRLTKMCREAEKRREIEQLDFPVRMFCEELKKRNRGRLPKTKGGRPTSEHRRLLIAADVHEAIERRGRKRGSVEWALNEVAQQHNTTYQYVREIHYQDDPNWRRTVAAELAARRK